MIRKAVADDAAWIAELTNASGIPNARATAADAQKWIADGGVLVDDSKLAFIKTTLCDDYLSADLAVTHPDAQNSGLSMILFSYVWAQADRPVRFWVVADSPQEYYCVARDKYAQSRCTLLKEGHIGSIKWRAYEASKE